MSRTWEDNAAEFGALSKQGVDVRLAVLVATSVYETDNAGGRPSKEHVARMTALGKVSNKTFSGKAGTTDDRVKRHLDAWVKCAAEGWCEVPTSLKPEDALNPDLKVPNKIITWIDKDGKERTGTQFQSKFDASDSGGRPRASVKEIVQRAATDAEYAQELTAGIAKAAPDAVARAVAADTETTDKVVHEAMSSAGESRGFSVQSRPEPPSDPRSEWQRYLREAVQADQRLQSHISAMPDGDMKNQAKERRAEWLQRAVEVWPLVPDTVAEMFG